MIIKDIFYSTRDTDDDPIESPPQESKTAYLATGPSMTPVEDTDKLSEFSATVLKADVSQRRDLALYRLTSLSVYVPPSVAVAAQPHQSRL